jgi:metal-sulfur cluster biosynthetic enzyme
MMPEASPKDTESAVKVEAFPEDMKDWLRPLQDPELMMSLVELGLVYGVHIVEKKATVQMTLTSPGCPMGDEIVSMIKGRMIEHPEVETAEVEIVWEPKWDPAEMASEECKEALGIW